MEREALGPVRSRSARVLAAALGALFAVAACGEDRVGTVTSGLAVNQASLDWGVVAVGEEAILPLAVRNDGRAPLQLDAPQCSGPFSVVGFPAGGITLRGGESRALRLRFSAEAEGRHEGELALPSDADRPAGSVRLSAEALRGLAVARPSALDFGQVPLGSERTLAAEIVNLAPRSLNGRLVIEGADADSFTSSMMDLELAPHETRRVEVRYRPRQVGAEAAALRLACDRCGAVVVSLTGRGTSSCIALEPPALDLGVVEVGTSGAAAFEITNVGGTASEITDAYFTGPAASELALVGIPVGAHVPLDAGARLQAVAQWAPRVPRPLEGLLRVRARGSSGQVCWAEATLRGAGGGSCLLVEPPLLDYGTVSVGSRTTRTVTLVNAACAGDVVVRSVSVDGASAFSTAGVPGATRLALGARERVAVTFAPTSAGASTGQLVLEAVGDDGAPLARPPAPTPLTGLAVELAPCQLSVTPPALDFGALAAGARASLGVRLRNEGADACYASTFRITGAGASVFELRGDPPGVLLQPAASLDLRVEFAPPAVGSFAAALEFEVSDRASPTRSVPLQGQGVGSCLSIEPAELDFGRVAVGCPPPVLQTRVVNRCPSRVVLRSLATGPSTGGELSIASAPAFPVALEPGAASVLEIRYAPMDRGSDSAAYFVDDGSARYLVAARGSGSVDPVRSDRFEVPLEEKVDVLFVLDNSGSMEDKQVAVGRNLASFLSHAVAQNVDYHLAVTTTGLEPSSGGWTLCPGGADGGENGRLFPADGSSPRILTRATPNAASVWARNTAVGTCHWLEQGLEAALRALRPPLSDQVDDPRTALPADGNLGFLRPEARLVVIFVSDEEDQSVGTVDSYSTALRAVKSDPALISVAAVVSPEDLSACANATTSGRRYIDLASRFGGQIESICTADWSASLDRLGSGAFGGQSLFPLTGRPSDPSKLEVLVNGGRVAASGAWSYDAAANAVRFVLAAVPGAGSLVEIRYPLGCP